MCQELPAARTDRCARRELSLHRMVWSETAEPGEKGAGSVRRGKNGLGRVAKERGMTTIYYADVEQWSAVFGLWSMEAVHIYG